MTPIITVKDDADALEVANGTEYGLDGCVFRTNINRALDLASNMQDGTVSINAASSHGVGHLPFERKQTLRDGKRRSEVQHR